MAGINWTYAQVRNYVQGSGCTKGDDRIEIMMISCLQELWTKVSEDPFYSSDESIQLAADSDGEIDISEFSTISSILMRYGDGLCRELEPQAEIPPMKSCGCYASDDACTHDVRGLPADFKIVGDTLTLQPAPDQDVTLEITGFRDLNCELHTTEDDVRVWNAVDLPERYQAQLANLVLSKFYAEEGDFTASAYWEQKVSTGLSSLLDKRGDRFVKDAGRERTTGIEPKLIRRGSEKQHGCGGCGSCSSCFNPGIVQTLYEEKLVHVDCHGNPV